MCKEHRREGGRRRYSFPRNFLLSCSGIRNIVSIRLLLAVPRVMDKASRDRKASFRVHLLCTSRPCLPHVFCSSSRSFLSFLREKRREEGKPSLAIRYNRTSLSCTLSLFLAFLFPSFDKRAAVATGNGIDVLDDSLFRPYF